jgi:hypothetical protein
MRQTSIAAIFTLAATAAANTVGPLLSVGIGCLGGASRVAGQYQYYDRHFESSYHEGVIGYMADTKIGISLRPRLQTYGFFAFPMMESFGFSPRPQLIHFGLGGTFLLGPGIPTFTVECRLAATPALMHNHFYERVDRNLGVLLSLGVGRQFTKRFSSTLSVVGAIRRNEIVLVEYETYRIKRGFDAALAVLQCHVRIL